MTDDTKNLVEIINRNVASIKTRTIINSVMFAVTSIIVVALMVMSFQLKGKQNDSYLLASKSYQQAVEAKARLDVKDEQYVTYIKDMIEVINKVRKDNPTINLPNAPELRPAGFPKLSDDPDRLKPKPIPTATAKPTPKPVTKIIRKKVYISKPKDWPWYKSWPPK